MVPQSVKFSAFTACQESVKSCKSPLRNFVSLLKIHFPTSAVYNTLPAAMFCCLLRSQLRAMTINSKIFTQNSVNPKPLHIPRKHSNHPYQNLQHQKPSKIYHLQQNKTKVHQHLQLYSILSLQIDMLLKLPHGTFVQKVA